MAEFMAVCKKNDDQEGTPAFINRHMPEPARLLLAGGGCRPQNVRRLNSSNNKDDGKNSQLTGRACRSTGINIPPARNR